MVIVEVGQLAALLVRRFPRELRDMVYHYALKEDYPIQRVSDHAHTILTDDMIGAEAAGVFYSINTFVADFRPSSGIVELPYSPIAKRELRHVVISAEETAFRTRSNFLESEKIPEDPALEMWALLHEYPRLETVEIRLQKESDGNLNAEDFGPVLYHLRERNTSMRVRIKISFDNILRRRWDSPLWNTDDTSDEGQIPYKPMGFIDITDFFDRPTAEDWAYVSTYLPDKRMPVGRSIEAGLLDLSPKERRALGKHYVVKEPALFRILLEEQFDIYKRVGQGKEIDS